MPPAAAASSPGAVKKPRQKGRSGPCSLAPNRVQRTRPLSSWVRDRASGSSAVKRSCGGAPPLASGSGQKGLSSSFIRPMP